MDKTLTLTESELALMKWAISNALAMLDGRGEVAKDLKALHEKLSTAK